jgi:signal transduction histidine kinase
MDFFLWGELKRMVYQNKPKPTSEAELKRRIEQAVETLKQKTGVLQKATTRAQLCLQANGRHF